MVKARIKSNPYTPFHITTSENKHLDTRQVAKTGRRRPKSVQNLPSTSEDATEAAHHNITAQPTRIICRGGRRGGGRGGRRDGRTGTPFTNISFHANLLTFYFLGELQRLSCFVRLQNLVERPSASFIESESSVSSLI